MTQTNQGQVACSGPNRIFVGYCNEDARWFNSLQKILKPLVDSGKLELWDNSRIKPGQKWREEIEQALAESRAAILLISPDFFARSECSHLLESVEKDGMRIFWLSISASCYNHTAIANYQCVNDPAKPLDRLDKGRCNEVLVCAANTIHEILEASCERPGNR